MANAPSPLDPLMVINDPDASFFVGLYTNSPTYDTWMLPTSFTAPDETAYSDQPTSPDSLDEDSDSNDVEFDVVQFDGSSFQNSYTVNGFYIYAAYADTNVVLGFQPFAQPQTLGPGSDPLEVAVSADVVNLASVVPINNN